MSGFRVFLLIEIESFFCYFCYVKNFSQHVCQRFTKF